MPDTLVTIASYILPLFAMIVLIRCMRSMLGNKTQTEIWGYIHKDDGVALINHWENLIGRSNRRISVCRMHRSAVYTRYSSEAPREYGAFSTSSPRAEFGSTAKRCRQQAPLFATVMF